jgi:hypothetical protein
MSQGVRIGVAIISYDGQVRFAESAGCPLTRVSRPCSATTRSEANANPIPEPLAVTPRRKMDASCPGGMPGPSSVMSIVAMWSLLGCTLTVTVTVPAVAQRVLDEDVEGMAGGTRRGAGPRRPGRLDDHPAMGPAGEEVPLGSVAKGDSVEVDRRARPGVALAGEPEEIRDGGVQAADLGSRARRRCPARRRGRCAGVPAGAGRASGSTGKRRNRPCPAARDPRSPGPPGRSRSARWPHCHWGPPRRRVRPCATSGQVVRRSPSRPRRAGSRTCGLGTATSAARDGAGIDAHGTSIARRRPSPGKPRRARPAALR